MIRSALDRKQAGSVDTQSPGAMDFNEMARRTISGHGGLQGHMQMPDVKSMTRRLVANMIKAEAPNITEKELEILLDQWAPDAPGKVGREKELPREVWLSMVRQFLLYGTGRLSQREQRELKSTMPDWTDRYWSLFSEQTRQLLTDCIKGQIPEDEFWKMIGGQNAT